VVGAVIGAARGVIPLDSEAEIVPAGFARRPW
jgi:hypothetical protein